MLNEDLWTFEMNGSLKGSEGDDDEENKDDNDDGSDEKWNKIIGP